MKFPAVITAGAPGQQHILQQTLVTHENRRTSIFEFLAGMLEGVSDRIALIIPAGARDLFTPLIRPVSSDVTLIEQPEPRGYGHALYQAREFTAGQPFLHMVGDHFYLANEGPSSALVQTLVEIHERHKCSVTAVQPTRESLLPYFGAIGGPAIATDGPVKLYQVDTVLEKPTPTQAECELYSPGLRRGHYLCFFGIHLLSPAVMDFFDEHAQRGGRIPSLSEALQAAAQRERVIAALLPGQRFDIGSKYGLLQAQLALGLNGPDRAEILSLLLEQAVR
ncbi:MAG: UTP--glucose-1-phosphate uridylyltransferase [Acidobacteria bacterium]|nr:UTP--glucose-1-phosphate uridylyltransferase [Acidobacteriota bacterium]